MVTIAWRAAIVLAAGVVLLAGCASGATGHQATAAQQAAAGTTPHVAPHHRPARQRAGRARDRSSRTRHGRKRHASAARPAGVPAGVPMPDRALTPGSIQSSDTEAICTPGWSAAHRDVSYATEDQVAAEYGLASHYGYEIDHLIPLELGGSNAVSNLWPEPYGSRYGANEKDGLEDYLHEQVCYHGLALATAQHEIAVNWYAAWIAAGRPTPQDFGYGTGPGSSPPPAGGATCTVTASYSAQYGDYDVYVHSNQPDQSVTATASGGASATWHTDSSGYADVYLHVTGDAAGQTVTAKVGGASCSATLG